MQHTFLADKDVAPDRARSEQERAILRKFRTVFRVVQEHSRWVERQCGVSAAQLWAMWELFSSPGVRVSELSRALSIHQSTTSNLLDKLEQKGLIERRRGGPDQRVVRIHLTDKGAKLVEGAPRPAQGALMDALHRLPSEALLELDGILSRLVSTMGVDDRDAGMRLLSED